MADHVSATQGAESGGAPRVVWTALARGEPSGLSRYLYFHAGPPVEVESGWPRGPWHGPLVVAEVRLPGGSHWTGVFEGMSTHFPLCEVRLLPEGRRLLVLAFGSGYVVDVEIPSSAFLVPGIPLIGVREVPGVPLVIVWGFQDMIAFGPEGEAWRIEYLVPDCMEVRSVTAERIQGGRDDMDDRMFDFDVDPRTGHVRASW